MIEFAKSYSNVYQGPVMAVWYNNLVYNIIYYVIFNYEYINNLGGLILNLSKLMIGIIIWIK